MRPPSDEITFRMLKVKQLFHHTGIGQRSCPWHASWHRDGLSKAVVWLRQADSRLRRLGGGADLAGLTYFPLNAFSRKQAVNSTNSTEAEVVSANHALRAEGLPVLALFEKTAYQKVVSKKAANRDYTDEEVPVRVDPEINEIRNGHVESGLDVSNIQPLEVHFPEFCQVKLMEDNQATITIFCHETWKLHTKC